MNRRLFHLIGYAAPVCLLPYLLTLPAGGGMRERFPLLFFAVAVLALAGFVAGILWLMFFIEYRGVWFGKEDRGRPRRFEESDLPQLRETGLRLQKRLKTVTLYSWPMVLRPVLLPDGRRVFNVRYDFVSSVSGPFRLEGSFPETELIRGGKYCFHFRACAGSGEEELLFLEFDPAKRSRLSAPASKSVSPLDLRNSPAALAAVDSLFAGSGVEHQVSAIEFHARRKPFLEVSIFVVSPSGTTWSIRGESVKLAPGRREILHFRLNPDLSCAGHLKKGGLLRRLLTS